MFRFTIRDLLIITFVCAACMGAIMLLFRRFNPPAWTVVPVGCAVICPVVGMLVGQDKGGLIGLGIGVLLTLLLVALGLLVF